MKIIKYTSKILFSIILVVACSNKKDHSNHDHPHSTIETKSELVREGVIDVASIDNNSDGKIYECPMDWNVLDDKNGSCPVCGMDLKEYSLEDIKSNLDKYGYEYKK